MRHGNGLGFDFLHAAVNSNFLIEIEIRGGRPEGFMGFKGRNCFDLRLVIVQFEVRFYLDGISVRLTLAR